MYKIAAQVNTEHFNWYFIYTSSYLSFQPSHNLKALQSYFIVFFY